MPTKPDWPTVTLTLVSDDDGTRICDAETGEDLTEALNVTEVQWEIQNGKPVAFCRINDQAPLVIGGPRITMMDPRAKQVKTVKHVEFIDGSGVKFKHA
jgi:hypothetical protein